MNQTRQTTKANDSNVFGLGRVSNLFHMAPWGAGIRAGLPANTNAAPVALAA